jgi:hypothetical protein
MMKTIEIHLGIRDLMDKDAVEIHRDKVPSTPEGADRWLSNGGRNVVFDHGDHRWRYDMTGGLIAYYLYRKRGEGIKTFWCNE